MQKSGYAYQAPGIRSFFMWRDVVLPAVIALGLTVVSSPYVLAAMIIGGHAHFAIAYLYQYRAKKIDRAYLVVAACVALGAVLFFLVSGDPVVLFFAVSVLFAAHFSYDEFTLHDEAWTFTTATTWLGFVALFVSLTIDMIYSVPWLLWGTIALVALGVIVRLLRRAPPPSRAEWYLWLLSGTMCLMVLDVIPVGYGSITTFIIILHFFNWMIGYGIRLLPAPSRAKRYWTETVVGIALAIGLYVLAQTSAPWLATLFFAVSSYYAWAIGHIALSFFLQIRHRS